MVKKKLFVSKVDEKLKAAEARRAELERAKAEEIQKKIEMRRDRMKKFETDENKRSNLNLAAVAEEEAEVEVKVSKARNIKEFKYMKQADGKVIKLDWSIRKRKRKRKRNDHVTSKLFTVNGVEKLIEKEQFEVSKVILGILKRSISARHPIQNKFAQLHGRITEIQEKNNRTFAYENALNFIGSISPIRLPEFEADMGQLSRISSPPTGIEELQMKYSNIEELTKVKGELGVEGKGNIFKLNNIYNPNNNNDDSYKISNYNNSFYNDEISKAIKFIDGETMKTPTKLSPKKSIFNNGEGENNFSTVISPMKRPYKEIEAEVVYTPQRKSGRRLNDEEIIYDDERVSQILLNDPNSAFISNPYITTRRGRGTEGLRGGEEELKGGEEELRGEEEKN
jgi:hypothetical protein